MSNANLIERLRAVQNNCAQYVAGSDIIRDSADALAAADKRIAELEAELERERMRLVACGVVAMADTPDSAKEARKMYPDYESASCSDVARRVDECIELRSKLAVAREALQSFVSAADNQGAFHGMSWYQAKTMALAALVQISTKEK